MSWSKEFIRLIVDDVPLEIAAMQRDGQGLPVVFLHGFGSTKEDYADVALHEAFAGRPLIAYDAPGCGESSCGDLSALTIPFLQHTADRVLQHFDIGSFHLAGHSMGGLTALLLADALDDKCGHQVVSFCNIEGNLAPEDCFLSRQVDEHPADSPAAFLEAFAGRVWSDAIPSHALYAASLRHKVRAGAVTPIFRSMVDLSDNALLMQRFLDLACPKMLVHGAYNRGLSYLGHLLRHGVQLAEIEGSGHFPMYSNPAALWTRLGGFIHQAERDTFHG